MRQYITIMSKTNACEGIIHSAVVNIVFFLHRIEKNLYVVRTIWIKLSKNLYFV